MAKQITIAKIDENKLNINSQRSTNIFNNNSTPKFININDIQKSEIFSSLFKIDEDMFNSISSDMLINGFDINQPVIIWKEQNVLIDGHTRVLAAEKADIKSIPIVYASFATEDDALDYMYKLQFNRRNITDEDLIELVEKVATKFVKKYGEGSKAEFIAKQFYGLSIGKAKQVLIVLERSDADDIKKIKNKTASIYQIYLKYKSENDIKLIKEMNEPDFNSYEKSATRFNEKGTLFLRDYENEEDIKIFTLSKKFNTDVVKHKLQLFFETQIMNKEENELS